MIENSAQVIQTPLAERSSLWLKHGVIDGNIWLVALNAHVLLPPPHSPPFLSFSSIAPLPVARSSAHNSSSSIVLPVLRRENPHLLCCPLLYDKSPQALQAQVKMSSTSIVVNVSSAPSRSMFSRHARDCNVYSRCSTAELERAILLEVAVRHRAPACFPLYRILTKCSQRPRLRAQHRRNRTSPPTPSTASPRLDHAGIWLHARA